MDLGRNAPCPCGSGKKYKKCCLAKDEAKRAEQAKSAAPAVPIPQTAGKHDAPKPPPDPRIEACNARGAEFEAADYEGKIDLFTRTLDDPELMDGEMAFEMLNQLFREMVEHGERDRFDALLESLHERRPEVYAEEAHYFLSWRITNALVGGCSGDIPALARELAPSAAKQIDIFNRVESQLAYHGQLSTLVEAMRLAWPQVKSSDNVVPWGIDEFCIRAMAYELLDHIERSPLPDAADRAFLKRLEFYGEIKPVPVAAYLAHVTGRAERQWAISDFEFATPCRDWDDGEEESEGDESAPDRSNGDLNLYHLTVEFLGYLRRVEGVPYAKGELGRRELYRFLLDRHAGKLEYRESMLQSAQRDIDRQRGRRSPPKREFRPYEHMLTPDRERLEHFLVGLLGIMNQLYYRAAALFEIIPAWLRFLETRRLIDPEARVRTLGDLAGLANALCRVFSNFADDPSPRRALESWHAEAAKALPE